MGYSTVDALINDVASFYNDTDALTYVLPESTRRRILHYIQRTVDEIWYYRPWSFKMLRAPILPGGGGESPLPFNYATVGPKGALYENATSVPWREVDYQEWTNFRQNGQYKMQRAFCIGNNADAVADVPGEGLPSSQMTYSAKATLLFPDPIEAREFTLYYESTPPRAAWDGFSNALDYNQPLPLFDGFHNAILLGTIAKLQESKGDPRPQYRSEYVAAIASAAAQHLPLTSRMQQLPRALPGGQW